MERMEMIRSLVADDDVLEGGSGDDTIYGNGGQHQVLGVMFIMLTQKTIE